MVPPGGMSGGGFRGNRPRMRGISRGGDVGSTPRAVDLPKLVVPGLNAKATGSRAAGTKKRVLFVCVGNAIRSQMAEAFARHYGSDIMTAHSAGLSPSVSLPPITRQILEERNMRIDGQFPKGIEALEGSFDLVVNMTGQKLAIPAERVVDWNVSDPVGQSDEVLRSAASQIEGLVLRLILDLRSLPGEHAL
jgi:arsenate reductase